MNEKFPDMDLNYPVWGTFSEERIKRGDWVWPDRYYFYNPEGHDRKPAALYAIGYARGGYGKTGGLYDRMMDYINRNGLEICGDTYEEYPLNEVCITEDKDYLIRTMITVREKNGA
jgi:effector-binding domain-containing protein